MRRFISVIAMLCCMAAVSAAADDPMAQLKDLTLSYFKPLSAGLSAVEGGDVTISAGEAEGLKKGMRLKVLREGAPFIHPVTKEVLGKVETAVGKVEVREPGQGSSKGVLVEGEARVTDRVRISETKIRALFVQDKSIDWYLADDLYRKLKTSGRFEMVDTDIERDDETKILSEARRLSTEVAIIVTAREADNITFARERAYWVSDGSKFIDTEVKVDPAVIKELKLGEEFFRPRAGEAAMIFDLPFKARFVAMADVNGDGKQEIVLSNGRDIRVYSEGVDLKLLWEIKGPASVDHLWLDVIDLNRNGRDEVVVTAMISDEVVSTIYELEGEGFKQLWSAKYFLRRLGNGLIGQDYSPSEGYAGDVFSVVWDGGYRKGERLQLPKGINIYDFVVLEGPSQERMIFAYDEAGHVNLYDSKGLRLWRSSSATGGFLTTFRKPSPASYVDSGVWSVKDRLVQRQREVLVVYRQPLTEMARGLGYKSSSIKDYWWNGYSMEESVLVDGISGSVLDYDHTGDKVVVLTSPMMGVKFGNILKGENPLGVSLAIYSLKGR